MVLIFPDNFQTRLAYQSLGALRVFCFAMDGVSANDMVLTSSFLLLRIQGYKMLWNNYSTATFKTFFKGLCYHDNLIIRWLPKGAVFGLATRKFIWGLLQLSLMTGVSHICPVSETPLTVPWGPAGWGPQEDGWGDQQQTLLCRASTLISATRSIYEASTMYKVLTVNYEQTQGS